VACRRGHLCKRPFRHILCLLLPLQERPRRQGFARTQPGPESGFRRTKAASSTPVEIDRQLAAAQRLDAMAGQLFEPVR
jgi:hypothetical protein